MRLPSGHTDATELRMDVAEAGPFDDTAGLLGRLMALSLKLAHPTIPRGGALIHGALAARDGTGVLLTGVSGVGKSTASERLAPPWCSLCDDTALVVRDSAGAYWAHPWPTWSRLFEGHDTDSWDVGRAVRLAVVFRLSRNPHRRPAPLPVPEAASWLLDRVYDCSWDIFRERPSGEARALQVQLFHNACDLAAATPVYPLQVTLRGTFWKTMEQVLDMAGTGDW